MTKAQIVGPDPNDPTKVRALAEDGRKIRIKKEMAPAWMKATGATDPNGWYGGDDFDAPADGSIVVEQDGVRVDDEKPEVSGYDKANSFLRNAEQGPTFGLADEMKGSRDALGALRKKGGWRAGIVDGGVGAIPFLGASDSVKGAVAALIDDDAAAVGKQGRDADRAETARVTEAAPGYGLAGTVAGIAPSMLMPVAQGPSIVRGAGILKNAPALAGRIAAPAAQGAAEGALRGVGVAKEMDDVPAEAAKSGAIGGFFGGVGGALGAAFPWIRGWRAERAAKAAAKDADAASLAAGFGRADDAALVAKESAATPEMLAAAKAGQASSVDEAVKAMREANAAGISARVDERAAAWTPSARVASEGTNAATPAAKAARIIADADTVIRPKAGAPEADTFVGPARAREVAKREAAQAAARSSARADIDPAISQMKAQAAGGSDTVLIPKWWPRDSKFPAQLTTDKGEKVVRDWMAREAGNVEPGAFTRVLPPNPTDVAAKAAAARASSEVEKAVGFGKQSDEIAAKIAANRKARAELEPFLRRAFRNEAPAEAARARTALASKEAAGEVGRADDALLAIGKRTKQAARAGVAFSLVGGNVPGAVKFGILAVLPPSALGKVVKYMGGAGVVTAAAARRGAPEAYAAHKRQLQEDPAYMEAAARAYDEAVAAGEITP